MTGIDFLDKYIGPSERSESVYGLLGPIGVGKSTLGAMIAVEGAKAARAQRLAGHSSHAWVHFNFDGSKCDMEERLVSHGAKISRNLPGRSSIHGNHSRMGNYHAYETEFASELPSCEGVPLGEHERLDDFWRRLWNEHLLPVHLSSTPPNKDVPPAQAIAHRLEHIGAHCQIAGVVIDYVGRAVKDYLGDEGKGLTNEIQQFTADCRRQIAARWQCPVWLIHQLNGSANRKKPGDAQHHRDAANCRHFGDELDACFVLGTRATDTEAFLLECTKSSVEPPGPTILRFHPHFASLIPAEDLRVDRSTNLIVECRRPIHFDPTFGDLLVDERDA